MAKGLQIILSKRFKIIFALLLAIMLVITLFCCIVIKASNETPLIVANALRPGNISLKLTDMSSWQLNVLLKVEDPDFYNHNGLDFSTPGAGATTITQSLVKQFYFDDFKPGLDKIKQSLIARYALNRLVSKNDQLTLFINYVYLGNANGKQVIGLDNAAKYYYNKELKELDTNEYISIVAMIIAPNNFHVINRKKENEERCDRIKKVISGAYRPKSLTDIYYDVPGK